MFALAIGVTVVVSAGAWMFADHQRVERERRAVEAEVPVLPKGRVQLLDNGLREARFLAVDGIRRDGNKVEATVLRLGRAHDTLAGAAIVAQRNRYNCGRGRMFDGKIGRFDFDGRLVGQEIPFVDRHGRVPGSGELEVAILCDDAPKAAPVMFVDLKAGQREVQTPPPELAKVAESRPNDADAWAWMCSIGAKLWWRAETPSDCDHALRLAPASAEVRQDRAYLYLKIGRWDVAGAAFAAILADDPNNAAALFGASLVHAGQGDRPASRARLGQALARNPKIPVEMALHYHFRVGEEYERL